MFSQLLAAIAAIPKLISTIENLIEFLKQAQIEARLARIEDAFNKLDAAKTKEEKKDAVKDLHSSISG